MGVVEFRGRNVKWIWVAWEIIVPEEKINRLLEIYIHGCCLRRSVFEYPGSVE